MNRLQDTRKRILTSRGAGFLGSRLLDRLLEQGQAILCVDNLFTGTKPKIDHLNNYPRFAILRHDVTTAFLRNRSLLRAVPEKGILRIAIVEEAGYIGANLFVATFAYLIRSNNIFGLIGCVGLLGINLSEMNFFSFDGHSGFFWTWVMALTLMMCATQPGPEAPPGTQPDGPGLRPA